MAKVRWLIKFGLFNLLVVVLAFILFEGTASMILLVQRLLKTKPVAERLHTEYDPELGWVNIPNSYVEDMYGPGLHVKINSQGFRNEQEFKADVPPGKLRLICSGDSFTFGFGVSNDQTWCQILSTLDPRLETVNMGQGGYGIDQAYLWYKRDGAKLAHDMNIFAFVTTDFDRMQNSRFLGYDKPVLKVEDNQLILTNVPVPKRAFYLPWTTTPYQPVFDDLKSVQFLHETFFQGDTARPPTDEPALREVAWQVLEDLAQLNAARNSTLALVYLPVQADYEPGLKTDTRRQYVQQAAAQKGLLFIDLVNEFRQLPRDQLDELFIPNGQIDFPGAAGHYSAKGHIYIAGRLYQELLAQPKISNILAQNN